jgi:hypothetical protein
MTSRLKRFMPGRSRKTANPDQAEAPQRTAVEPSHEPLPLGLEIVAEGVDPIVEYFNHSNDIQIHILMPLPVSSLSTA